MVKFLNTRKAVAAIEDLIKEAGDKLVLISPYLKLSKDFKISFTNNWDLIIWGRVLTIRQNFNLFFNSILLN